MKPVGVIFDMDGVLIDSYQAHYESWRRMGRNHDLEMTERQFRDTFGRTSREIIGRLWPERAFTDERIADLDREKEALFRELIDAEFPIMPGAVELLQSLKAADFRIAIGSSGPPENVAITREHLLAIIEFDAVVHSGDVVRGKPDPEVFLVAAERMGVEPSRAIVIEDAVPGQRAARAAGMKCVSLVSTGHTHAELADADLLLSSLSEITPSIALKLLGVH